jgi:ketosteroid isomerase-like protein
MKPAQVDELFAEAFNAGDVDALLALYEPDAPLVAHTGDVLSDPPSRRAYAEGFFAISPKIKLTTAKIIENGNLALVYSPWTITGTEPDGTTIEMAGDSVVVLRLQPDRTWRFAIDNPGWRAS